MTRASYAVLLCGCALAGCNSVLGIEEGNLRDEGGAANVEASTGGSEGGAADGGSLRSLECAFVFAAHRTIADLSTLTGLERTYSAQLFAESVPGAALVRLVAYHAGANLPFDLFSVDAKDNGTSTKVASELSIPLDMHRIDPSSIGLLATSTGASGATLNYYVIADSDGQMPKLVAGPSPNLGMVDQVTGMFLAEPPGDIAYAASARSSPTQFDLVYGKASIPGQQPLSSGAAPFVTDPRAIVRMGNAIHVFFGDPGGMGSSEVTLVDGMTPMAPRSLGPPQFALLSAATNPLGKLNVAFAEIPGAGINLRIGQIDVAQIGSFTAMDVPIARQFQGLADVPYTTRPRWFADTLVAVGPTSAAANELSIAWGEARGQVQAQKKLLTAQRNGNVRTAAWAAGQQLGPLGPLGGFIDLFWIETYQDDAGQPYDVLYYDQVRCI